MCCNLRILNNLLVVGPAEPEIDADLEDGEIAGTGTGISVALFPE